MYAVWVDARDLSYHNFECILPLDRALQAEGPLDIKISAFKQIQKVISSPLSSPYLSSVTTSYFLFFLLFLK